MKALDSDDQSETSESFLYSCEICSSSFPSADFVDLHKKVFHAGQVVPLTYVEDAESLITSFVFPVGNSPSVTDLTSSTVETENTVKSNSEEKKTNQKTKYNFRKRLLL